MSRGLIFDIYLSPIIIVFIIIMVIKFAKFLKFSVKNVRNKFNSSELFLFFKLDYSVIKSAES